ncbi:hypothetical protein ACTJLB_07420 [Paraburkholderia sp. 22098]|uniref:hypothetical protein n=1 Tax=Paraburkholderia sp. 22098 TaxID=3453874 RepID=UPI003F82A000
MNTTANILSVHIEPQVRLPVRTKDGHKTSVSIPQCLLDTFVAKCGSRAAFRRCLNAAVKQVEPMPGYSRSQRVRMLLEKQLASGLRG